MSDVNSERARQEARESVGNRAPREGETAVEAAMRRFLGAEMFDELHRPEKGPEKKPGRKPASPTGATAAGTVEEPEKETGAKG
jgi:hypothetical protein